MANIYYDGELGSNSTGNGSQSAPYQFPLNSHGAVGDTFYLRRGKTHMLNYIYGWTPKMATSPIGAKTRVAAWGESQIPHAIIDNSHATGPTINISGAPSGRANLLFEDMWVKASGHTSYPVYAHCYTAPAPSPPTPSSSTPRNRSSASSLTLPVEERGRRFKAPAIDSEDVTSAHPTSARGLYSTTDSVIFSPSGTIR